jgi:hypothetical protein
MIILFLGGCNGNSSKKERNVCTDLIYKDVESALKCADNSEKLLLFVFIPSHGGKNISVDWNILKDPEVIATAQRDYVLVSADPKNLNPENATREMLNKLERRSKDTFFVVTNLALYPFCEFDYNTPKDKIIDHLEARDGP